MLIGPGDFFSWPTFEAREITEAVTVALRRFGLGFVLRREDVERSAGSRRSQTSSLTNFDSRVCHQPLVITVRWVPDLNPASLTNQHLEGCPVRHYMLPPTRDAVVRECSRN